MSVVYVVLPLSVVLAVIAVVLFVLAVRRGQFDDLETPGVRALLDDEPVRPKDAPPCGPSSSEAPRDGASGAQTP